MNVVVLGAGSWGTALALVLARNGFDVTLAGRSSDNLDEIRNRRENLQYLPGFLLPKDVRIAHLDELAPDPDLAVVAVPSAGIADILPHIAGAGKIVLATKGLAPQGSVLTDVIEDAYPSAKIAVLSGPNLALELARGIPTTAVSASRDPETAERVRDAFMCRTYRIYVSEDVIGVELAGAMKNVMAIGAGVSDGLGYGDNTKASLLARGLNEMARLGLAYGAKLDTFMGIAGVGDLFATANSKLSRNYRVGYALGQGRRLRNILEEIGQVAEGVATVGAALLMAKEKDLYLPITDVLRGVIDEEYDPRDAVQALMERTPRKEGILSS